LRIADPFDSVLWLRNLPLCSNGQLSRDVMRHSARTRLVEPLIPSCF